MKNTRLIPIMVLLICLGCSDKLDLYPTTQQTEGSFYKTIKELEQSTDEIYRQLGIVYDAYGLPDLYSELYSDNTRIILRSGANNFGEQISDYFIQSDNGLIRTAWENCYKAIYICNNAIYQLENTSLEIESEKLNSMKAQAIAVRSLIYFNMVRAWGDIPYVSTKITSEEAYNYLRIDKGEVYQNLIDDLNWAKNNLLGTYNGADVGRITKYGAAAILAKIHLTLGNNPAAKVELEEIINSGNYSLDANNDGVINIDDYLYLFKADTKNSRSSVVEVQYMAGVNASNSNHQDRYSPFFFDFHLPGETKTFRGQGHNTPSEDLFNEFEVDDPRKDISMATGYINLTSGEFVDYPYTLKFYDPNFENAGQNFEIIRYADILLMYAEVTQDPQYLNMVRERAGLPSYGSAGYPSADYPTLTLAIEHERRVELCFEFHRMFDLVRSDRAIEVMSSKGYDINNDKLLFPIPLNERDINPELTQNNGYN